MYPHAMALDYAMGDQIEQLDQLIHQESDGSDFFAKNYITSGMEKLLNEGLRRLAGKSTQAVFELTQAMGGGKTHTMIALGLLVKHDQLRQEIIPEIGAHAPFSNAKVVAFTGRNYPNHFLWGEIASQLGKKEQFAKYWQDGAAAPDEPAWRNLIGDDPTLIMLDELPPYFDYAMTRAVGGGTLAQVTTAALSNLLSAALKLKSCCIVISNLSGVYQTATGDLRRVIRDISEETNRQARRITPVELGGDEIYQILKKRLFEQLPSDEDIETVAQNFTQAISEAEKSKSIAKSKEQISDEIRNSYPFHPSMKDVIALFRNNESYRQTRGLMQFVSKMIRSVWNRSANDIHLIGLQHLDMNDVEVREEINRISDLRGAISHDIANNGNAQAELIDAQMNSDVGSQVATLLMASSLSSAVDAVKGLTKQQMLEYLIAPNRSVLEFSEAFDHLKHEAWYLHKDQSEAYYFSNVENLTKRLATEAARAPQPKIDTELQRRLEEIFQPRNRNAYQAHQALPKLDEIKLNGPRTLLILSPDTHSPPEDAQKFYETVVEKNNLCLVTGDGSDLASLEDRVRDLYAIAKVKGTISESSLQQSELDEKMEAAELDFNSTVTATFNKVYFPMRDGLVPIKLSMTFDGNQFNGEEQIEKALSSTGASKLTLDIEQNIENLINMAEMLLWPLKQKRVPWKDVAHNAITNPRWVWLPNKGLEQLRKLAEQRGLWRYSEDGYIEKGPFEKPKTSMDVLERGYDGETGTATLYITAKDAGESAIVYYSENADVSEKSSKLTEPELQTTKTRLYFLAIDPAGNHETGEMVSWSNKLTLLHQPKEVLGKRTVTLKEAADRGKIYYTLNGSNPQNGHLYEGPIEIGEEETTIYGYVEDQEVSTKRNFTIPRSGDKKRKIDPGKPASIKKKVECQNTADTFKLTSRIKGGKATLKGVTIEVGSGNQNVYTRFGSESTITAEIVEQLAQTMREAIGDEMAEVRIKTLSIDFKTGHDLETFLSEFNMEVTAGEVEQ